VLPHIASAGTSSDPASELVADLNTARVEDSDQYGVELSQQRLQEEKRKVTEQLANIPDIDEEEIQELEELIRELQAKRQKLLRITQLRDQITQASADIENIRQHQAPKRGGQTHQAQYEYQYQDREDEEVEIPGLDNFTFDSMSPLSKELQAAPWPPNYKPTMLPYYNGQSHPKTFRLSYEAMVGSFGGDTFALAKSLVMALE
jgi:hypothetical protein